MIQLTTHHSFYEAHKVAIWLGGYYVLSAFTGSLPAPTAKSGMFYQFFFKFCNTLGANIARAYSTTLEHSPNFESAVDKLKQQEQPGPKG